MKKKLYNYISLMLYNGAHAIKIECTCMYVHLPPSSRWMTIITRVVVLSFIVKAEIVNLESKTFDFISIHVIKCVKHVQIVVSLVCVMCVL